MQGQIEYQKKKKNRKSQKTEILSFGSIWGENIISVKST